MVLVVGLKSCLVLLGPLEWVVPCFLPSAFLRCTTRLWPFISSLKHINFLFFFCLFVLRLTLIFEKIPPAAFDLHLWRFSETALRFGNPLSPSLPHLPLATAALPDPHRNQPHSAHPSSPAHPSSSSRLPLSTCDATGTCSVKWSVQLIS